MGENMRGKRGENMGENFGKMQHIPREGEVSSHPCHAIGCMATIVHYTWGTCSYHTEGVNMYTVYSYVQDTHSRNVGENILIEIESVCTASIGRVRIARIAYSALI